MYLGHRLKMRIHRENPFGITTFHSRSVRSRAGAKVAPRARAGTVQDDLDQLDVAANDAYLIGQGYIQDIEFPPLLICDPSTLRFIGKGGPYTVDYIPQLYTTLKSVSHLVLGVTGLLVPIQGDPAGQRSIWWDSLKNLITIGDKVYREIDQIGLSQPALDRNRYVMKRMIDFGYDAVGKGTFDASELAALSAEMGPYMLANSNDACIAQLDYLDSQVRSLSQKVGQEEWSRVVVLIEVAHQPRVGFVQGQYFAYYLGDDSQTRLIFGENIFTDAPANDLVATVLHDRMLATDIFGDPFRMERDLLGDAADAYLLRMFGRLGTPDAPPVVS